MLRGSSESHTPIFTDMIIVVISKLIRLDTSNNS